MITTIDFQPYPDNHVLGPQFSIASTTFRDLGANASFVNVGGGAKGLQFHDDGIDISLAGPARWARFELGAFNGPFTIEGYGPGGQLVSSIAVTAPNTFHTQLVAGRDEVLHLRLVGGGNEAVITSLTADYV